MAIKTRKKRTSKANIEQIYKALLAGKDAKLIAEEFNISVASVYNYRTRMNREGKALPAKKRGRKPKQAIETKTEKPRKNTPEQIIRSGKFETYQFIINGVSITLSGKTKNVHISPDALMINF